MRQEKWGWPVDMVAFVLRLSPAYMGLPHRSAMPLGAPLILANARGRQENQFAQELVKVGCRSGRVASWLATFSFRRPL